MFTIVERNSISIISHNCLFFPSTDSVKREQLTPTQSMQFLTKNSMPTVVLTVYNIFLYVFF